MRETRAARPIASLSLVLLIASMGSCDRHRGLPSAVGSAAAAPAAAQAPANQATAAQAAVTPKIQPSNEARALSDAFATAARAIRPSVVRLDVETAGEATSSGGSEGGGEPDVPDFLRRFFDFRETPNPGSQGPMRGTGSGVIIDTAGHILTNTHVVRGASKVTIKLADDRSFPGKVVGTDPLTDVAVVRFEHPPAGLVIARLGNSDALRIGDWAIAVGSPLGMDQTVTAGIISGIGETGSHFRFQSGERVRKYVQTDAKINPGNSGGPLVNLEGEVIGINTLINVGPGGSYGFAIPINQASQVAGELVKEGRVRYPMIGASVVSVADAPDALKEKAGKGIPAEGAFVAAVTPGGPAAAAGIQAGDVITKVGGRPVKTAGDLVAQISELKIGETVPIDVVRDGKPRSEKVKLAEVPSQAVAENGGPRIGVGLQTLTPPIATSLGIDPTTKGAVVTEVKPGSPAARAGLVPGDVIRQVDKQPIASADDAVASLRESRGARLLRITNASGSRFVTITPGTG